MARDDRWGTGAPGRFDFWVRWLVVTGAALTLLGIALVLLNATAAFGWLHDGVNAAFWDGGRVTPETARYQHWVFAVVGATLAGWGVFVVYVARGPFRRREPWAWTCTTLAVSLWFVLDTAASAAAGVWVNVAVNVVVAVAAGIPLVATWGTFATSEA